MLSRISTCGVDSVTICVFPKVAALHWMSIKYEHTGKAENSCLRLKSIKGKGEGCVAAHAVLCGEPVSHWQENVRCSQCHISAYPQPSPSQDDLFFLSLDRTIYNPGHVTQREERTECITKSPSQGDILYITCLSTSHGGVTTVGSNTLFSPPCRRAFIPNKLTSCCMFLLPLACWFTCLLSRSLSESSCNCEAQCLSDITRSSLRNTIYSLKHHSVQLAGTHGHACIIRAVWFLPLRWHSTVTHRTW